MNKTFIITICIIASAAFGATVVYPKYQNLRTDTANVQILNADIASRKSYYSQLEGIDNRLQNYSEQLSMIDEAIPPETASPFTYDLIQKEVSQSGMVLNDLGKITSSKSSQYPDLTENDLPISVSGSYGTLQDFLASLENSARIIGVKQISFSSPNKGTSFNVNLIIKFYSN